LFYDLLKKEYSHPCFTLEIPDQLERLYNDLDIFPDMSRAKHWCFTLNNYTDEDVARLRALEETVAYICFGREVGESGTPHLQGFVSFTERKRLAQCTEILGQCHVTVARTIKNAIEYCKKDGDYEEYGVQPIGVGGRSDLDAFKEDVKGGTLSMKVLREKHSDVVAKYHRFAHDFVQDHLPRKEVPPHVLNDWQQRLNHDLNMPPDDRKVIFIIDRTGNKGKSWFSHYYCTLHDNAQVLLPGKKADMVFALDPTIRVLFIDAPRSKQGEYLQYDFIEDVKNGYIFNTKYESCVKSLGPIHVVVNMNEMPDMSKLSEDRYDIRNI
jgi:hypothetical protein